jgi:hypothetical protein
MAHLFASFLLAAQMPRLVTLGFLLAAVPLLGVVALDLRRAAKASTARKNGSMEFVSRYRGMAIFFESGEDLAMDRVAAQRPRRETR